MAISLISEQPLEENAALFENDAIQGEDEGDIYWSDPEEVAAGSWRFNFEGADVQGTEIQSTELTMYSTQAPSPSQVFWYIAQKAKEILCPSCSNGY